MYRWLDLRGEFALKPHNSTPAGAQADEWNCVFRIPCCYYRDAALRLYAVMTDHEDHLPRPLSKLGADDELRWEHELKYEVSPLSLAAVRCHLDNLCRADDKHPHNVVTTLYFDTPSFQCAREKIDGDHLKTKYRVRWYVNRGECTQAFAEVKQRFGGRRHKVRFETAHDGALLAATDLDHHALLELPMAFRRRGIRTPDPLLPVMVLSYQRQRWVEPSSGARVALDTTIRVDRSHPLMLCGESNVRLERNVLEVKGEGHSLPGPLRHLATLGCVRESVSKYGDCFQRLAGGIA